MPHQPGPPRSMDGPSPPPRVSMVPPSLAATNTNRDADLANYIASLPSGMSADDVAYFAADAAAYTQIAKNSDLVKAGDDLVTDHTGEIDGFVAGQRLGIDNGICEIRNAVLSLAGLDVHYMNQFGQETIKYVPSSLTSLPPLRPWGESKTDFVFDGYIMFRTNDWPQPASQLYVYSNSVAGQWVVDNTVTVVLGDTEWCAPEHWYTTSAGLAIPGVPGVDGSTIGGTFRAGTTYYMIGFVGYLVPPGTPPDISLCNSSNRVFCWYDPTGSSPQNWYYYPNMGTQDPNYSMTFVGVGSLDPTVAAYVPAHTAVYDIQLNGDTIYTYTCAPSTDGMSDGVVDQIVIIPVGKNAFRARSYCDLTNPTEKKYKKISPGRKDKLLPAYFPFALKISDNSFWNSPTIDTQPTDFWAARYWSQYAGGSLAQGWLWSTWGWTGSGLAGGYGPGGAAGMGGCWLGPSPPTQVVVTAPVMDLKLVKDGANTLGYVTDDGLGNAELYVEFFSRGAIRPVTVGFTQVAEPGQRVLVNDKPRYWYANPATALDLGGLISNSVANPFVFTPNSPSGTDVYEVVPDTTVTIPDPKHELDA